MKRTFLSGCLLLASMLVLGQKQYVSSAESYVSDLQPAAMILLSHAPKVVMDALEYYKTQPSFSTKKHPQAYVSFGNTALMQKNIKDADLTFRVGENNPHDNSTSAVYLLLDTKVENGKYAGDVNRFELADAQAFLENLALVVDEYATIHLNKEIKLQNSILTSGEKQQEKFDNRCARLDAKKQGIQQKVAQGNKRAVKKDISLTQRLSASHNTLADQTAAVGKQKNYLAHLNSQRKQ